MKKRILSAVLTLVMILSLFPVMQLPASAASLPWIREMDNDPSVGKTTHDVYLRFKSDGDIGSTVIGSNCDGCLVAIAFPAKATWGSAYDNGHASTAKIEPYMNDWCKLYTKYLGKNFMTNSSDYIEIWINDVDAYPTNIIMDIKRVGSSRSYHGDVYCTIDGQVIVNKNNWGTNGGSVVDAWDYNNNYYVPLASAKVNISTNNVIKPGGTVSIPYTVTGKDSMGGDVAEPVGSTYSRNDQLRSRGVVVSEKLVAATSTANFSCSGVTLDPSSKQIKVDGAAFNSAKKTQKFRIATTVSLGANSVYDSLGSSISDPLIFGGTKTFYSDVITLYPGEGTINYNAGGGSGSMASQNITYGTAATLAKNTFTYNPTLTFKSDIGTLDVPSVSVPASFGGWMDKTTTTFNGKTYPYYEFDAAGYANRNGDVLASSAFGNGVYDKEAMLRHYIDHGKNEYENGSANRAAATGYFGTYPDGATVKNLAGEAGTAVSLYAKWNYGTTTLPTPTTDGYTFRCWTADLMDIATLTDNLEISDTTRGTIGYNDGYAVTENLIPVVGGITFTSNMEVCGVYAYDKDGNFLKRCSSYATTHTIPYAAAFVRVEVCTKKELSFEDFKNLSLEYSVPAGTVVPVAGNQTYTANWQGNYNIRFDANGGIGGTQSYVIMGASRYSDVSWLTVSRKGYEFAGWTTKPNGTELVYGADGHCIPGSAYWDESGNWKYDGDVVVYAKWAPLPVTITAQTTAGGSVTGTKTVNAGENVELLATSDDGYEFIGWYDGETLVCETENFTVENVVEDKTYTAQFKEYVCNHSHDGVEFKPWKNSKSLPSSAGNYYLATDVTLSEVWTAPAGEVNLCLNGKSINLNSKHIAVENGATLNIYDCGDTVRYYDADGTTGKWTLKSVGTSNYTTEGGVITGGSNILGGAISVNDSTLNLYGGNLVGNTASSNNGGAVYITNGTLTIDGANILGNYAYSSGGGVFANQSTVTINSGRISYNRACITDNKGGDGGGIYLSNCTTTMNGGSITHNANLYDGTGVMNSGGGTFTMNGGTISDNTNTFWGEWSDYCGGAGICNDSDSTLVINNGSIINNTGISNGAGVFNRGTFNMNGGTIEGNTCVSLADNIYKGYGDGVANEAGAVFTMTDGYIGVIHNDMVRDDTCRGVYNRGTFTMTGGEIFASSDDMSSCYGLSNSSYYSADGTETSSAVANIGGNAVITGQCGYKPFAVNGTGTVNVSGNAVLTAKNVNDCKDNRSRTIYLSRGTLNVSGNPELISLHDFSSSNPPDTNGIRFEPSVTVNLSGGPVITATAHIQLEGTPSEPSKYFNIVGKLEKPVSPYVVVKRVDTDLSEGAFTNGWTEYMSDAEHDDYFTGPEGYGVLLYENELRLAEHAHKNIIYSAWEEIDSLPTTTGNYRLESDVTISETWNVPAGVTNLCLNGHKITYTGNSIAINLVDNVELNVTDCIDSGMLYAESEEDFTSEAYTGIWMSGGKFTMDSGKIYVKNTYPKANVRAIVARNGASLSLSGEAIVEAYGSGAPFGICSGSEATVNLSDDAYIYAENIDPSARDGRVRAVYGETGAVINIYGSPVIEAYSPSTTNTVNAIRLNESTAVFNGTPALIAKTDSGLAAEVHCEKTTDLISVNCNLENDTIYRVYKPSSGVFTASANTEYNNVSKFASAIDGYEVTKESDGQLHIVEVSYYTITAVATEGGNAEGTATVEEGQSVTLTAKADEGYEFIGWFEGEIKVCETEKFVVENVTADKTYTAKFEEITEEAEHYDVWLGGAEFTSENLVIDSNDNSAISGRANFDPKTYTLTLDNFSYEGPGLFKDSEYLDEGIALYYSNPDCWDDPMAHGLNIVLIGENEISCVSEDSIMSAVYIIGNTNISGSGSLVAKAESGSGEAAYYTIYIPCSLSITDATISVVPGEKSINEYGIFAGSLVLDNATIESVGNDYAVAVMEAQYSEENTFHKTLEGHKAYVSLACDGSDKFVYPSDATYEAHATYKYMKIEPKKEVEEPEKPVAEFTITAEAGVGGSATGTETVKEGESVTLTAAADEGYEFIGWYDGETKVSDANKFVVENVSADKTYTAKFEKVETEEPVEPENPVVPEEPEIPDIPDEPEEPVEPSNFDFESIRTENGKNITVDHNKKVISVDVEEGDNLVLYVHQKEIIPGGQIKLNSYNGNKVTYNTSGVYKIYSIDDEYITVSVKVIIDDVTEIYDLKVRYEEKESEETTLFDSIRTENGTVTEIDHEAKKIYVDVDKGDDYLQLYVHQKDVIPGGQIRMKSYNGNKVTYDASGIYKIYTLGSDPIIVSAKVIINEEIYIYDIVADFNTVSPGFHFDEIKCDNAESIEVDHAAKTIRIYAEHDAKDVTLYKKQYDYIKGTLALTSFMGNRVQSNQTDGTYKVCFVKNNEVSVKAKITIDGMTEEYIITVVFSAEWGFDNLKTDNASLISVDHDAKTVVMNVSEGSDEVTLYIDQVCDAGAAQVWMKSYNGNKVTYNSSDRTYTIKKGKADILTVSVKVTMLGETRIYDLIFNF